ncbi:MAG: ATP-binding protein [Cardiobacteriaceae bacterium]|nr:ATP-binding protein [Cardiobacteriaceae bacterium]
METTTKRLVELPALTSPLNLGKKAQSIVVLIGLGLLCASITLFSLQQLSNSATTLENANQHYTTLLTLTALGFLGLSSLALWQMIRLAKRLASQRSAARLSLNLSLSLFVAALIPIGFLASFSWQYLSYNLEQTFNTHVNATLDHALTLTRNTINLQSQQALDTSRQISTLITDMNHEALLYYIESLRRESGASALAVFDSNGILLAFAHQNLDIINTPAPSAAMISRVNETLEHISYSQEAGQYQINVLLYLDKFGYSPFYLQSTFPMPLAFNHLVNEIEQGVMQHRSYGFLRPHIRANLLFILGLVLILSVLISAYLSLTLAQYFSRPIQQLIDATRHIAAGRYSVQLSALPNNELGDLVRHFNQMSIGLHHAHAINQQAQQALRTEQSYLQTIMDNVSAGIIVLNEQHQLERHNQHANFILQADLNQSSASLQELLTQLDKALCSPQTTHQQEVTLSQHSMRKVLMCHLSRLANGHLLVFNDITEYHHNQRHAAWEEVARRLAHEIKNPLTPIQLQTERLQRKLYDALPNEQERQILTRATDVIINQVKAMQQMVDEFSQIAKPLNLRRERINISILIQEIAELYSTQSALELKLPTDPIILEADRNQLRQVLHNVLKNAVEASSDKGSQILIVAECQNREPQSMVHIAIEDNGTGFINLNKDPFEPYVTHKEKGTGLGLAIVKKIIQEHGGQVHVGNSSQLGGACVHFTLPIS